MAKKSEKHSSTSAHESQQAQAQCSEGYAKEHTNNPDLDQNHNYTPSSQQGTDWFSIDQTLSEMLSVVVLVWYQYAYIDAQEALVLPIADAVAKCIRVLRPCIF